MATIHILASILALVSAHVSGDRVAFMANPLGPLNNDAELRASARPYLETARKAYRQGDYAQAEAACRSAINIGPKDQAGRPDMSAAQLLCDILIKKGDYAEAASILKGVSPNPGARGEEYPSIELLTKALVAVRIGDYETALAVDPVGGIEPYFRTVPGIMENAPGVSDARHLEATVLLMRAIRYCSTGQDKEYAEDAFAADKLVPRNALISYYCAKALCIQRRYIEAEAYYKIVESVGKGDIVKVAKRRLYGVSYQAERQRKGAK